MLEIISRSPRRKASIEDLCASGLPKLLTAAHMWRAVGASAVFQTWAIWDRAAAGFLSSPHGTRYRGLSGNPKQGTPRTQ